jgi:hypothetical protein
MIFYATFLLNVNFNKCNNVVAKCELFYKKRSTPNAWRKKSMFEGASCAKVAWIATRSPSAKTCRVQKGSMEVWCWRLPHVANEE